MEVVFKHWGTLLWFARLVSKVTYMGMVCTKLQG